MNLLSDTDKRPLSERMQLIADRLAAAEAMSPEERHEAMRKQMQENCDRYNSRPGNLRDGYYISTIQSDRTFIQGDGYDCKLCQNRGDTMHLREYGGGIYEYMVQCRCMNIRKSIWRMRKSGLEKSIRECKFERFDVKEEWQKKMVDLARKYINEGVHDGRWLYFGGQPGCGKTHICTAVAGKLLYEMDLIYAVWPQISKKLKAIVNDAEEYGSEVGKLQEVSVLYFDDFFKPVSNDQGEWLPPTPADMKLAFEILNYRYINKLPTIISSEWYIDELGAMDEATASRISERCGEFAMMIARDKSRNHRLSNTGTVV